jgi:hypothetical protein
MERDGRILIVGSPSISNIAGYLEVDSGSACVNLQRLNEDLPSSIFTHPLILENGKTLVFYPYETSKGWALSGSSRILKISAISCDAFVCSEPVQTDFERIKAVEFSIHGADNLLSDFEYEGKIASDPMNASRSLIDLELSELRLTLSRRYSFGPSRVPIFGDYRATLEFRKPVTRKDVRNAIVRLRSCLSFFGGAYVTTSDFLVSASEIDPETGSSLQPIEWLNGLFDNRIDHFNSAPLLYLRIADDKQEFLRQLPNWLEAPAKWQKFFSGT